MIYFQRLAQVSRSGYVYVTASNATVLQLGISQSVWATIDINIVQYY